MAVDLDLVRFGEDLVMPDDDVRVTPTGDWPSVGGRDNLRSALLERATTNKGAMLYRPQYGAGALSFVETAASPAGRAGLANSLRLNLLRDDRLAEVRAAVATTSNARRTSVTLTIQPRGQPETESLSFAVE